MSERKRVPLSIPHSFLLPVSLLWQSQFVSNVFSELYQTLRKHVNFLYTANSIFIIKFDQSLNMGEIPLHQVKTHTSFMQCECAFFHALPDVYTNVPMRSSLFNKSKQFYARIIRHNDFINTQNVSLNVSFRFYCNFHIPFVRINCVISVPFNRTAQLSLLALPVPHPGNSQKT